MSEVNSILGDVRRALGRSRTLVPPALDSFGELGEARPDDVVTRLVAELSAVGARIYQVTPQESGNYELARTIAEICEKISATSLSTSGSGLACSPSLIQELSARGLEVFVADGNRDHEQVVSQLAHTQVGITAVQFAIAETGTLVLTSDEANSLLVSLLPPVHIAILKAEQIVASLDHGIQMMATEPAVTGRSVSFITGPSRTSDVELTLSIGVHGPKELHVIIL